MRAIGGLVALVLALGIGLYLYKAQYTSGPAGGAPPKEIIDVTGVEGDLLAIGRAERLHMASNGSYAATLQDLGNDIEGLADGSRRGYRYTISVADGQHFTVTAEPTDPAKQGWPTLTLDDTMQITKK